MRRTILLAGVLPLVSAFLGAAPVGLIVLQQGSSPLAHAQNGTGCSDATLNGSYGLLVSGFPVTGADGTPLAARALCRCQSRDGG